MKKSHQSRVRTSRQQSTRRSVLRIERLEERTVFSGASPTAVNDLFHALTDQTLDVSSPSILANDTDAEGDALTAKLFSNPQHGTLALSSDGTFQYTPDKGFAGIDSFVYQADDGTSTSLLAAVTLRVGDGSQAPASLDDSYVMNEDETLTVATADGVLTNDTDANGDVLTAAVVTEPAHGTLSLAADGSFVYTPEANFQGEDSFSYLASDGTQSGNVANVAITVKAMNDAPVAADDSLVTDEDSPLVIEGAGVLENDSDVDGDPLAAELVSEPTNGVLTFNADGTFTYQPNPGFQGEDSFSYLVSDGTENSNVATVSILVQSVNDAPVATNDEYTTAEDLPLVVDPAGLLANDQDADGDTLTAALASDPLHGTVTLNADGSFTYTPEANYSGVDGFSYTVSDGTTVSEVAAVTIHVTAANDTPTAANDEYSVDEDQTLTSDAPGVLANDEDLDGDTLVANLVSGPLHGSVTLNPDGSFSYTPEANYNGVDGFSYSVNDGTTDSEVAAVTINVGAVSDAPVANADEYAIDEDTPLVIDAAGLLANDSDADGDALTAALVTGPANGAVVVNADGSFSYTPNADFNGTDTFTYTASDGTSTSAETTVTITVGAANDAPVATADEYSTDEDTPLVIDAAGLLGNDTDADGDALTAALVTGPANGSVVVNADGSFSYTPNADFNGTDTFTYTASDGTSASAETTVTITVGSMNDTPVANADDYSTDEDTPLVIEPTGLLANDTDADGDTLTAALVTGPASGTVIVNADGSFSYTPNADFTGTDSFTYTASDGTATSAETTVTITVGSTNDAPVATADEYATDEDTPLIVDATGLLANDTDADGDALTAALVTSPANSAVVVNADGSFSYTPNANFSGTDSFTYTASDGTATSAETTVTITVGAVNDAPVATADEYSTDEDTPLVVDATGVLANDTDADGDSLTAALVTGPANGAVVVNADGSFSYTPNANFSGTDSFTYTASDGTATSAETTVTIMVNGVADAPLGHSDAYNVGEDLALNVAPDRGVLANDFDSQGRPLTAELVTGPSHGTLTLNADGSFSYVPESNYVGPDSFTYVGNNGVESSAEMTVTIEVQTINDAPVAAADEYSLLEGGSLQIDAATGVEVNDSDVESDPLAARLLWGPNHGTLTLNADGSFSYAAEAGYIGDDSFTYQLNDGMADSNVATVTLHIGKANQSQPPLAAADSYEVAAGATLTSAAPGVLGNDTAAEGVSLTAGLATGPSHGTLVLNNDGSFSYTPEAGFSGVDSFTYQASDGAALSEAATVTFNVVAAENQRPVAVNDYFSTKANLTLESPAPGVLGNDFDPEGQALTASLFQGPQHGTVVLAANGSFVYTPNAGFQGRDSFVYRTNDGQTNSALAAVTIDVTPATAEQVDQCRFRSTLHNLGERVKHAVADLSEDVWNALLPHHGQRLSAGIDSIWANASWRH